MSLQGHHPTASKHMIGQTFPPPERMLLLAASELAHTEKGTVYYPLRIVWTSLITSRKVTRPPQTYKIVVRDARSHAGVVVIQKKIQPL